MTYHTCATHIEEMRLETHYVAHIVYSMYTIYAIYVALWVYVA